MYTHNTQEIPFTHIIPRKYHVHTLYTGNTMYPHYTQEILCTHIIHGAIGKLKAVGKLEVIPLENPINLIGDDYFSFLEIYK